jgi:hypothetical protein
MEYGRQPLFFLNGRRPKYLENGRNIFLVAEQLYIWLCLSVRPSVCLSVRPSICPKFLAQILSYILSQVFKKGSATPARFVLVK